MRRDHGHFHAPPVEFPDTVPNPIPSGLVHGPAADMGQELVEFAGRAMIAPVQDAWTVLVPFLIAFTILVLILRKIGLSIFAMHDEQQAVEAEVNAAIWARESGWKGNRFSR